mmetsp:Transcript_50609/g.83902  ORF Transcript_50609/g.83902 Transcript_50609/m.83902 type:complete len:229 (+) Transcript_50609:79-765(+)
MARFSSQGTGRLYPVSLNVYDLSPLNDYISWLGIGLYHSGLEVDGREWTFGSGSGSGTGVFECRPREVPGFRQAVPLGNLDMTSLNIEKTAWDLARDYPGSRYHLLTCNCNHFATELAERLGTEPVPGWVNRLAAWGAWFAWLLPRSLTGDAPVTSGGDGGRSLTTLRESTPKPTAFSGAGRNLREEASPGELAPLVPPADPGDRAAMRERAVAAALARERRQKEQAE